MTVGGDIGETGSKARRGIYNVCWEGGKTN